MRTRQPTIAQAADPAIKRTVRINQFCCTINPPNPNAEVTQAWESGPQLAPHLTPGEQSIRNF